MFKRPAHLIRNLHADRPALSYVAGLVIWLLTTITLLYFLRLFLLADSGPARLALSIFGTGVLAVHFAMSVFLGDGWKVRFRKLDRENSFIRFLARFG